MRHETDPLRTTRPRTVFVGRSRELRALGEAAASARDGAPTVVSLTGPGGIGKSCLLNHFLQELSASSPDLRVVRASGEEAETAHPYGVLAQLGASARQVASCVPSSLDHGPAETQDPLAVGADLLTVLGDLQQGSDLVVLLVEDLQWVDDLSARALLFAVRRLHGDHLLVLLSVRPAQVGRLGEGWYRFLTSDHRVTPLALAGLGPVDLIDLARTLGRGALSERSAVRLAERTGGNPLHCTALLEEFGVEALEGADPDLPVPRALADLVVHRLGALSGDAQRLVRAAAVLGHRCLLGTAAAVADLQDPFPLLDEALEAALLLEQPGQGTDIAFTHALVRQAIHDGMSPSTRQRLHRRAAEASSGEARLDHLVAATTGPDVALAASLEAAARRAATQGRSLRSAGWLADAAALSGDPADRQRRILDALESLLGCGEVHRAETIAGRAGQPATARHHALVGSLDFLAGRPRSAEHHLLEAWRTHDPAAEPQVGAEAAAGLMHCLFLGGRIRKAVVWGDRAAAAGIDLPGLHRRVLALQSQVLFVDNQGIEGLTRLGSLLPSPVEAPVEDLDAIVLASVTRVWAEDLERAMGDLTVCAARFRSGAPTRFASQCLTALAQAEYLLGSWDDAALHAELGVSLAEDADRGYDLPFVHAYAAFVPTGRGQWAAAADHVAHAHAAAAVIGQGAAVTAAATAAATLAMARGDFEAVVRETASIRAIGNTTAYGRPGVFDWRPLEIEALLRLGELDRAEDAAADLARALRGCPGIGAEVALQRLRAELTAARGDLDRATQEHAAARRHATRLGRPLALARAELAEARHLRRVGDRARAINRLRSARRRAGSLGAQPLVEACDVVLEACGVEVRPDAPPSSVGLTPAELGVARLVARGRTNRETATELYVSVKAVEFHLRNIYTKLGVHSRRELGELLRGVQDAEGGGGGQRVDPGGTER